MRAALIRCQGNPVAPNVEVVDGHPDPEPGPGDVLIRTEAAALNQLDLWVGRGVPGLDLEYPRISGSDGCGRVEAVGPGVEKRWVGQRVMVNAAVPEPPSVSPVFEPAATRIRVIGEHEHGFMAERCVAPVGSVLAVPDDVDPVEAAAFGLVHLTAWRMLVQANLRAGQSVLITGIGGGVALAALNICLNAGCRSIVTSRHQHKLDRASELGATAGILDTGEDWSSTVRDLTGRRGVDICVDSIGRVVHESCIKSLTGGGAFVTCGATTGPEVTTNLARLFWMQLRLIGSTMGDMDDFRSVVALFIRGRMRPVIDSVHEAGNAPAAYARLESGEQFGKVVVKWA